jgi:hypothetical protein
MNCSICGLPKGNIVGSVLHQCMCGWQKPNPPVMPQQRTWVGLTLEERDHLWEVSRAGLPRYNTFAGLVESKLKEKNSA